MKQSKTTILTSIGAALEYYDFVIYAMLASTISQLFFPGSDYLVGILKTFGVFAIGYLVRPLGGVLFGYLGDRYGRKSTFLLSISLMAFATLAIGLLPNYSQIGISATLLLIGLRIIQGMSFGAELPGAITFITEHAEREHRGLHCSFMFFGVGMGAMLSALINYVLTSHLTTQQMLAWGWRIPFLYGGLLAIIGFMMRRHLEETPLFHRNESIVPLKILLTNYRVELLRGIGITLFPACFIIMNLYFPAYAKHFYHYSSAQIYLAMTVGLLWSTLLLPLCGQISDIVGRKTLMLNTTVIALLSLTPLFYLLKFESNAVLFSFMLIYQTFIAILASCYPSMLAEAFPTRVRYTGVAICYNVALAFAGLMPVLSSYLLRIYNHPYSASVLLSIIGLGTLFAIVRTEDRTHEVLT